MLPLLNKQGTYLFFNLKTRSVLKGDKWKALPTPQWVIDRMNQLAKNQKRQLPKDPEFSRNVASDDEPHIDDEDLFNASDEDQDVYEDDGNLGPNIRDDWDVAEPYDDDCAESVVVEDTGANDDNHVSDPYMEDIYMRTTMRYLHSLTAIGPGQQQGHPSWYRRRS
jgi:hypothetical protein